MFHCIKMSQYFPKPYWPFSGDINVGADLDIDKLVPVPVDLSKLNDVVEMMLLKKLYMMN